LHKINPMKRCASILISLLLAAGSAPAIIFYSTGDASHNTNAPSGALENSGWQWQGEWNKGSAPEAQYLGTPISYHYFITAKHVAATTNNWVFRYHGETYQAVQSYPDASSDFQLWRVDKPFDSYAPLYTNNDEDGRGCVIFGRGKIRGDEVLTDGNTNGWLWGARDNKMRWGTNKITSATGGYLVSDFDGGGNEECTTADKDSGGAVFIKDTAGVWRLAGINLTLDPFYFSTNSAGTNYFNAACFDYRGLYYSNDKVSWTLAVGGQAKKQESVATRISYRYSWITNVIGGELDQDADLLPDWWEKKYTNNATAMSASVDIDGDGFSNLQEYTADTNPTNALSFFAMSGFIASTNQTVYFTGSTARQYQVFYTTNDLAATNLAWIAANTNKIWGGGTDSSITVTNMADKAFYRLRATLP